MLLRQESLKKKQVQSFEFALNKGLFKLFLPTAGIDN